jgi:primary-amine oxidase
MDPTAGETAPQPHPLDPLSAQELRRAVEILRSDPRIDPGARFADVYLDEPGKDALRAQAEDGTGVDRRVCFRLVTGPALTCTEAVASLTTGEVLTVIEVAGVCPTMLVGESWRTADAVRADRPCVVAASRTWPR